LEREKILLLNKQQKLNARTKHLEAENEIYKERLNDLGWIEEQQKTVDEKNYEKTGSGGFKVGGTKKFHSKAEQKKLELMAQKADNYEALNIEVLKQRKNVQSDRELLNRDEKRFKEEYNNFIKKKEEFEKEKLKLESQQTLVQKEFHRLILEQKHVEHLERAFDAQKRGWARDKQNWRACELLMSQQVEKIEQQNKEMYYKEKIIKTRTSTRSVLIEKIRKIPRFISYDTEQMKVADYIADALQTLQNDELWSMKQLLEEQKRDKKEHTARIKMIAETAKVVEPANWERKYT